MRQRRISGIGGRSIEGLDISDATNRVFWTTSSAGLHLLFTKEFIYPSNASEDPIDITSGLTYRLGVGAYGGISWVREQTNRWSVMYSIDSRIGVITINPSEKLVYQHRFTDMVGTNPVIFTDNDMFYYVSFLSVNSMGNNLVSVSRTADFITFERPQTPRYFTNLDDIVLVSDNSLNIIDYYNINEYIHDTFNADDKNYGY